MVLPIPSKDYKKFYRSERDYDSFVYGIIMLFCISFIVLFSVFVKFGIIVVEHNVSVFVYNDSLVVDNNALKLQVLNLTNELMVYKDNRKRDLDNARSGGFAKAVLECEFESLFYDANQGLKVSTDGFYSNAGYFCVQTKGLTKSEVAETTFHELAHYYTDRGDNHFNCIR